MDTVLTLCGSLLSVAILVCLVRMVRGPTVLDRILTFDAIAICAVGLMVVLSIQWKTPHFLELILIFSLLGFLSTVAFVLYLQSALPDDEDKKGDE